MQERHDEDLPAVPPTALEGLIKLIRTMLGLPLDPADPHLMAEISDFLLSTHPAVNTFVCHAPSSFYFNQHKCESIFLTIVVYVSQLARYFYCLSNNTLIYILFFSDPYFVFFLVLPIEYVLTYLISHFNDV